MRLALLLLVATLPIFARSAGAPIDTRGFPGFTGAPGDSTCAICHAGNDTPFPGGSIRIEAGAFRPGRAQNVKVTVSQPEAVRWGFQITARWARDLSRQAGRFSAINTETQPVREAEYATHTSTGTLANGANGAKTFELEWTPPAGAEDGDIVFYAAGNAANNSGNNAGDRIYTTQARVQAEVTCGFTDTPVITRVIDAASGNLTGSSRALITIQGRNFAPLGGARNAAQGYVRDSQFPSELGCIAVEVAGQRVPILYVGPDQINVQAPVISNTGDLPVRVLINAGRPNQIASAMGTVRIQNYSPAFFTFGGRSVAARSPENGQIIADPSIVSTGRPARPGEIIELYATGLGATQTVVAPGALAPLEVNRTTVTPTITIGGTTLSAADILYSGLAPGNISGLYQINVRIAPSAANGDLPILMTIGGQQSVAGTTIPVRAP